MHLSAEAMNGLAYPTCATAIEFIGQDSSIDAMRDC
jgi:hypothetical protein